MKTILMPIGKHKFYPNNVYIVTNLKDLNKAYKLAIKDVNKESSFVIKFTPIEKTKK